MGLNLAILAYGSGTNAENITQYFQNKDLARVKLIITNNANAFVIQRSKLLNIPCVVIENSKWKDSNLILNLLREYEIDYIILAGFLLRIPQAIINNYAYKVINIHPALLPKYGGKGMYGSNVHKAVILAKEDTSGITIHFCNENYDEGDIIFQASCPVLSSDTDESLATRIHALEYKHFPEVIEKVLLDQNSIG